MLIFLAVRGGSWFEVVVFFCLFFFITGVLRVFQQQKLSVRLLEKYFFCLSQASARSTMAVGYLWQRGNYKIWSLTSMNYRIFNKIVFDYIGTKMSMSALQVRCLFRTVLRLWEALKNFEWVHYLMKDTGNTYLNYFLIRQIKRLLCRCCRFKISKMYIVCLTKYVKTIYPRA